MIYSTFIAACSRDTALVASYIGNRNFIEKEILSLFLFKEIGTFHARLLRSNNPSEPEWKYYSIDI